jgi:hypothetical protein
MGNGRHHDASRRRVARQPIGHDGGGSIRSPFRSWRKKRLFLMARRVGGPRTELVLTLNWFHADANVPGMPLTITTVRDRNRFRLFVILALLPVPLESSLYVS